jgi:polysaccharide biosynthesis/export protein
MSQLTILARSMRFTSNTRGRVFRAAAMCAALTPGLAFGAAQPFLDYRVHTGDVIEIAVAGLPEMRMRGNVQPDGAISIPLLGAVKVVGLTSAELRQTVQSRLAQKVYRQRANDGREVLVVIKPDEVSAAIVEYRPVYVNGDVGKPGELTFRPEMTVRQAVSLAGGIDTVTSRATNFAAEAAEARGVYEAACVELAKAEARVARIGSELKGKESFDTIAPQGAEISRADLARIRQGENDILQARLTDYRREQDFLRTSIGQLGERSAVLEKQQREEDEGARADTEELKHMIDLLNKGNVANPRVLDARRALLLSQTRALQVTDGALQVKKQSSDAARQLQHYEDDRKTELLKELQAADSDVTILKIKRDAARDKLDHLSRVRSRLSLDDASQMEIRVVRGEDGGSTSMIVKGDYQLTPGDVIEIAIKSR